MSEDKRFKYFANKEVNVITKNIKGSQSIGNGQIVEGNVVIDGILLDEDETCYYLGKSPEEVTDSVVKADVVRMFILTDEEKQFIFDDEEMGPVQ